jgi:hypothetical protein
MVCHKNSLLLFGGFNDVGKTVTCVGGIDHSQCLPSVMCECHLTN